MTNATTPIPPNPIGENFAWRDWFQRLSNKVYGSLASQNSNAVTVSGGAIDNTTIGQTTPAAGTFTTLKTSTLAVDSGLDGQVLIGRTSDHRFTPSTVIAGDGITLTPGPSTLVIASTNNSAHIEAYDLSASIALSATPILLTPALTSAGSSGITYNAGTGVFTFANAGSYSLSLVLSAVASAASQSLYLYQETWNGSAWVPNANSGKYLQLLNNQVTQIVATQAIYRAAGSQVRYWIYSNSNKITLQTFTLPGIVPTVYTPAIRIQYAA